MGIFTCTPPKFLCPYPHHPVVNPAPYPLPPIVRPPVIPPTPVVNPPAPPPVVGPVGPVVHPPIPPIHHGTSMFDFITSLFHHNFLFGIIVGLIIVWAFHMVTQNVTFVWPVIWKPKTPTTDPTKVVDKNSTIQ